MNSAVLAHAETTVAAARFFRVSGPPLTGRLAGGMAQSCGDGERCDRARGDLNVEPNPQPTSGLRRAVDTRGLRGSHGVDRVDGPEAGAICRCERGEHGRAGAAGPGGAGGL